MNNEHVYSFNKTSSSGRQNFLVYSREAPYYEKKRLNKNKITNKKNWKKTSPSSPKSTEQNKLASNISSDTTLPPPPPSPLNISIPSTSPTVVSIFVIVLLLLIFSSLFTSFSVSLLFLAIVTLLLRLSLLLLLLLLFASQYAK